MVEDTFTRVYELLIDRVSGPLKFRLVLQPLVAVFFAVRSGLKDTREGRPPYFWAIFTQAGYRRELLHDGWKSISGVFAVAFVVDAVDQLIVIRWIYPIEAIVVATILTILPYLLIRGPVTRIARRVKSRSG